MEDELDILYVPLEIRDALDIYIPLEEAPKSSSG
jgi:hypothetical protein